MKTTSKIFYTSDDEILTSEDQNEIIEYEKKLKSRRDMINPLMHFPGSNITIKGYDVYQCESKEMYALLLYQLQEEHPDIPVEELNEAISVYNSHVKFYGIRLIDEPLFHRIDAIKFDEALIYSLYHDIRCMKIDLNASENDFKKFLELTSITEDDVQSFYYKWEETCTDRN